MSSRGAAPRAGIGAASRAGRGTLLWIAFAYSLFVVYGSLVPLQFEPKPLAEAWARFRAMPYLKLGIVSRADWVSNILLFVPLAFLWQERLAAGRRLPARVLLGATVWAGCAILSVSIEFAQIYFPPRTVSRNDVLAESIGAALGLALWAWRGSRARAWLARLDAARGAAGLAGRALWVYLGLVLLYNVMPLDLTISPAEIFHKWREGRIVLGPWGAMRGDPVAWAYGAVSDVVVWSPIALLRVLAGRGGAARGVLLTVVAAAAVETTQLFIYTRVSDLGDVALAALGGLLGGFIGTRIRPAASGSGGARGARLTAVGIAAAAVWMVALAALFWYPYDFRVERSFAAGRLSMLREVPFVSYWSQTEYRALSGLLRRLLLFLPLGVALGLAAHPIRSPGGRRAAAAGAAIAVTLTAAAIELGQVFLPGKYPDSTDFLIEMVGGLAGLALFASVRRRWRAPAPPEAA